MGEKNIITYYGDNPASMQMKSHVLRVYFIQKSGLVLVTVNVPKCCLKLQLAKKQLLKLLHCSHFLNRPLTLAFLVFAKLAKANITPVPAQLLMTDAVSS